MAHVVAQAGGEVRALERERDGRDQQAKRCTGIQAFAGEAHPVAFTGPGLHLYGVRYLDFSALACGRLLEQGEYIRGEDIAAIDAEIGRSLFQRGFFDEM